ncbi:SRPBCC family protein [Aeromicrobium stalagmiti]|uniref:SRPBCC family protein n=1 Tax=Aeromicrobium stalagmiti TaxID=2738988 RepID=UPI001568E5CB|nr:SRPBCC family protein [Aeromicrobium stalagmiti]NRQ51196.1 SRPBCC family protein [Aeromicrobium stalagmiti]
MGQPPLETSIEIAAPPAAVWAAVSDLGAMRRRSPELVGSWMIGRPRVGRRAVNLNRRGWFVWPTFTRITRWKDPARDSGRGALAFHVTPTDVEWSYELEPTAGGGTLLTERRSALVDPSLVVRLTAKVFLGGSDSHDVELLAGMDTTLAAIAADTHR